jgi:hypothetical protein
VIEPLPPLPRNKAGEPIPDDWMLIVTNIEFEMTKDSVRSSMQGMVVPFARCWGTLVLEYATARKRTERIRMTLRADVQNLITMPDEEDAAFVELKGGDVGVIAEDEYGGVPIGDVQRRSFFSTDRGHQAIEYILCYGRAMMAARARAIEVGWQCRFERAVELSGRMNAKLTDHRLPGGSAIGKIVGYSFELADGKLIGSVTIGCAIGHGGATVAAPGVPTYVIEGYVDPGYQYYDGATIVVGAGFIGYTPPAANPNDDGLSFPLTRPPMIKPATVKLVTYLNGVVDGVDRWAWFWLFRTGLSWEDIKATADRVLALAVPSIELQLKPVEGGPFDTAYTLTTTDLKIPKMMDLG